MLSFLVHDDFDGEIKGLDQFSKQDWPNVSAVFQMYHLMIPMWFVMLILSWGSLYLSCMANCLSIDLGNGRLFFLFGPSNY